MRLGAQVWWWVSVSMGKLYGRKVHLNLTELNYIQRSLPENYTNCKVTKTKSFFVTVLKTFTNYYNVPNLKASHFILTMRVHWWPLTKTPDVLRMRRNYDCCNSLSLMNTIINDLCIVYQGLGYADIENRTKMSPETVLRIASISKPITMAAVAKQWELGKLDLDKPVQFYVPSFPEKEVNGVKVSKKLLK